MAAELLVAGPEEEERAGYVPPLPEVRENHLEWSVVHGDLLSWIRDTCRQQWIIKSVVDYIVPFRTHNSSLESARKLKFSLFRSS